MKNTSKKIIDDFSDEWKKFDQSKLDNNELKSIFEDYFNIFPFHLINKKSEGFDLGCGTGRWAKMIAPKVYKLNLIEPSDSILIAEKNLQDYNNITFYKENVMNISLKNNSQDFGYALGVFHHIEDTGKALKISTTLLKRNAPFLIYLYYAFDNRGTYYKLIWKFSNYIRKVICVLPNPIKNVVTDIIAFFVYMPISKLILLLEKFGLNVKALPLYYYRNKSFYTMRTDSRDRFGTFLEKRFTKKQIKKLMLDANLTNITFSEQSPYWCVLGFKK